MWLISTGKTVVRDGKTYFATKYTKNVMDKKCGDAGPWFEKQETIALINEKEPMSANSACFFNDSSIAHSGCRIKNAVISNDTEISGDIEICNCSFSGVTLTADERSSTTKERIISSTKITSESKFKAMVFIHDDATIRIERTEIYQTSSKRPSYKKALINIFEGYVIIKDSVIRSSGGGIYCDNTCLKICDSKILENSKIELRDGEDSRIFNSTVDANLVGSGFYFDDSHVDGNLSVSCDAKGLTFISSEINGYPTISVLKMGMYFNNTKISGSPSITLSGAKCYDVSFESCKISDNAKIESCGVELCFETFNKTTFSDDCFVKDAQTISSNISGKSFVYGAVLNACNISGNAIVGAELDKTLLPYFLASKIHLISRTIRNLYDFYIVKILDEFFFGFMDSKVYGINRNFVLNEVNFDEVQDSVEASARACPDFPLSDFSDEDYNLAYKRIFINSISGSISLLHDEYKKNFKTTYIVRTLVACSIMRIFSLYSFHSSKIENIDYSPLDDFSQYFSTHSSFDIASRKTKGISKDFRIIPYLIDKKPDSLSAFFDEDKKIDGVVI